ncbi:cyclin-domain-containing protein [Lophiotrema nucula]|uniref:Cyclin-domain-containing protein n=1 Tax=Lophiotrema nucula TaxID=690887 RepID=A0A6A5YPS9_9PLEO|nr:cyclin-domain-containing protein [Lophiotrema nucula]
MFGGAPAHPASQESPAVHQSSVRPSPHASSNPALRVVAPADVPMADSGPPPASSTPGQRSQHAQHAQHAGSSALSPPAPSTQQSAQPPPSPRFRPHSQHPTPAGGGSGSSSNPNAFTQPRTVPSSAPTSAQQSPISSLRSPAGSASASPRRIKVKSLSHIQSFATDEASPFSQTRSLSRRQRRDPSDVGPQYEISEMPVSDIIEMVAGLLTKITTTNDRQHEHLHRQIPPPEGTTGLSQQTTSVLAFHGKNVPSISILSYLSRIHKYCPTTYEVFLSLLVYFDRMTERVNAGPMQSLRQANQQSLERSNTEGGSSSVGSATTANPTGRPTPQATSVQAATPPPSGSLGKPAESPLPENHPPSPPQNIESPLDSDPYNLSHFFVVDSFNIHRLVIAGVTCASKFFSDVFYTNSRYAKVGGLPLVELNHLELQFLLLNDFRLAVPLEEMEAYGTMLVEFYAREVAEQHDRQVSTRGLGQAA